MKRIFWFTAVPATVLLPFVSGKSLAFMDRDMNEANLFFFRREICHYEGNGLYATKKLGWLLRRLHLLFHSKDRESPCDSALCSNLCEHQPCHQDFVASGDECLCPNEDDTYSCGDNTECVDDTCQCLDGFDGNPEERCAEIPLSCIVNLDGSEPIISKVHAHPVPPSQISVPCNDDQDVAEAAICLEGQSTEPLDGLDEPYYQSGPSASCENWQLAVDDCISYAIAIGEEATAIAGADDPPLDQCNIAVASGNKTRAEASYGSFNTAIASDYDASAWAKDGNENTAVASGFDAAAWAKDGNENTAVASGYDASAWATDGNENTAVASGYDASAWATDGNENTAVSSGYDAASWAKEGNGNKATASGYDAAAWAKDGNSNKAYASGHEANAWARKGNNNEANATGECTGAWASDESDFNTAEAGGKCSQARAYDGCTATSETPNEGVTVEYPSGEFLCDKRIEFANCSDICS